MQIRMGTSANGHTDFGRPVSQNSYSQVKEKVTRRFKPLNTLNVGCSAVNLTPPAWFFAALRVKSLTLQPWEDLWSQKCDIKIQYNLQAYYKASILWYLQAHWDQAPPVRPGRFLKNPGAHPGQVHPPATMMYGVVEVLGTCWDHTSPQVCSGPHRNHSFGHPLNPFPEKQPQLNFSPSHAWS